jgi:hypothetical protein
VTDLTSAKDFAAIVDSRVRAAVEEKAAELGGGGNKFQNNWPQLKTKQGSAVPIRRVRIRQVKSVVSISEGPRRRFVVPGSNHHMVILGKRDVSGRVLAYDFLPPVTMFEALERKRQGLPIVQRDHGPGYEFRCTLSEGDLLEARRPQDPAPRVWKVRTVRESGQLDLTPSEDARLKKEIARDRLLWSPTVGPLFLSNGARKVLVTYLGELIPAND